MKPATITQEIWDTMTEQEREYVWSHEAGHLYYGCFARNEITDEVLSNAHDKGMLRLDQLKHRHVYLGYCRNGTRAMWDEPRKVFIILRVKFGTTFPEDTPYPVVGYKYDVFVPVAEAENPNPFIDALGDYITNVLIKESDRENP